jgi:hypothetical protein
MLTINKYNLCNGRRKRTPSLMTSDRFLFGLCRMFSQILAGRSLPRTISSDNDLLFLSHRWNAKWWQSTLIHRIISNISNKQSFIDCIFLRQDRHSSTLPQSAKQRQTKLSIPAFIDQKLIMADEIILRLATDPGCYRVLALCLKTSLAWKITAENLLPEPFILSSAPFFTKMNHVHQFLLRMIPEQ